MFHTVFLRYLNISVTTGILIGVLLLLAPIFRKRYTVKWKYWVWLLLAVRLILPVTMPESSAPIVVNVPYADTMLVAEPIPETGADVMGGTGAENHIDAVSDAGVNDLGIDNIEGNNISENSVGINNSDRNNIDFNYNSVTVLSEQSERTEWVSTDTEEKINVAVHILSGITWRDVVAFSWLAGITVFALYHMIGHLVFRKNILRRAESPEYDRIQNMIKDISAEIGLKKEIRIKICGTVASPMLMGLARPILILPKEQYTEAELHFILLHELHHCKRNDLWYKLVLLTANAIHWYNPFVWRMCREANGDLERACDDEVLSGASYEDRKSYTEIILEGIRLQVTRENNLSTYFYGGKKELKNRFTNILDRTKRRSGRNVLLAVLVCVLVVGSLVACVYGDETNSEPDSETGAENGYVGEEGKYVRDIEMPPEGEIPEEDIYEVLETEDATYMSTRYGICRETESGREWIYKRSTDQGGFAGSHPQMEVYEDRLYLQTDVLNTAFSLDWQDNGIRWIDLQTLETGILDLDYGDSLPSIYSFDIYNGLIEVRTTSGDAYSGSAHAQIFLLPVEGKVVYNGKAVEDLTEQERSEYGKATSQWLLENPGTPLNVSNRTATQTSALLDMNGDGTVEEITLRPQEDGNLLSSILAKHEILLNDQVVVQDYASNLHNSIWAISPDGEEVLILLYEDGPGTDVYTRIYRYEDASLVEVNRTYGNIRINDDVYKLIMEKAEQVAKEDTYEEEDIYISSISYGNYSQAEVTEMLVLCKFKDNVHAAGLDRTLAMIFDVESMELIASKIVDADEVVVRCLPTERETKILFLRNVAYQGILSQYLELYTIQGNEWVEIPLEGVTLQENEMCYITEDNILAVVPQSMGFYFNHLITSWYNQVIYSWDEHAEQFVKEIQEEDIYEVLETEDAVYQATGYGIRRITEEGTEWIYKALAGQAGFTGIAPKMKVYENRLYLRTDTAYKDGDSDWTDCGIRWIDLETLETGILDLELGSESSTIKNFFFYDNLLNVRVDVNEPVQLNMWFPAPVEDAEVYNGKTARELTEQERQEYGCERSRWLTENPGTLVDVSNHTITGPFALVDMNMDGKAEEITLQMAAEGYGRYDIFNRYSLLLDGEVVIDDSYAENLNNNIWAVSLDGEEVLIVLYEDGPSDDPYTRIFRYEENTLVEVGAFRADIRSCEITEEGVISGVIPMDTVEMSFVHVSWQMNEQHRMEIVPQEAYDLSWIEGRENVPLLEELTLYTEPDGSESFVISPQAVKFLQTTIDGRWVSLETTDGVNGWFEVEDFTIVELGKNAWEVFEGLRIAG